MADINLTQGTAVPSTMRTLYKDMLDGTHALVISIGNFLAPSIVSESWRITSVQSLTNNSNSKAFAVTEGQEWEIITIYVEYSSNVTVGDRQIVVEIEDNTGDIISVWAIAGVVQIASLTRNYQFAFGVSNNVSFIDTNSLNTPLPLPFLKATDRIIIRDNNNVDSNDDMIIHIQYAFRTV